MKKVNINHVLIVAIAAPIVVAMLVAGGPALWQAIVTIAKALVPNVWVVLAYAYVAIIGFLIGLKRGKKSTTRKK